MRRHSKKCLLRYLAALAEQEPSESSSYEVNPEHEMSDFIQFRSEKEVEDLEKGLRKFIPMRAMKTSIPKAPEISEEEFLRIQRRITRKTEEQTLAEYKAEARARREIPEEILEATAEDILSEDDREESLDSDPEPGEEEGQNFRRLSDDGRSSRLDFVPIEYGDAGSSIREKVVEEEDSLISGFHPKSCSTSIGHDSLDQTLTTDMDALETSHLDHKRPVDQTIVPHRDAPSSSSSPSALGSSERNLSLIGLPEGCPKHSPRQSNREERTMDRTPSTMMQKCSLGPVRHQSCPGVRMTPIAKRLRRLGLFDEPSTPNLHTTNRWKSSKRVVQVYATPKRRAEALDGLLYGPTVDLSELVKFRIVERDPFKRNFYLRPSRLEDRFSLL